MNLLTCFQPPYSPDPSTHTQPVISAIAHQLFELLNLTGLGKSLTLNAADPQGVPQKKLNVIPYQGAV
ncbi:hypothetical protein BofuT4_uP132360.1 [Botrytis cinerea T4]|uniref:Uncharacterized protein n=1 Tax=Botryotinia fuckeliana (strain T4) TaxID=999810 RepID=G2YR08_BOTF4|nr:hypothetical protein BofuT4_uP132360.1 [Botrytis cinerea T4]